MGKIEFIKDLFIRFNEYFNQNIGGGVTLKALYLWDVIFCFVVHGSSLTDYFEYEFYKKRNYEKKTFVTWRKARKYWKILDDRNYAEELHDKLRIYGNFNDYLGRKWIYIKQSTFEEFSSFCINSPVLIIKPRRNSCGRGIRKLSVTPDTDLKEIYKVLLKEDLIIEEYIKQIDEMAEFHPQSVNTIRITVLRTGLRTQIMNAAFRIGNEAAVIDNHAAGGIVAAIDIESGIVTTTGIDKYSNRYIKHPMTGKVITGYQIPFWQEIKNLVIKIMSIAPRVCYVGWDIALTKSGPILIEGNYRGMFDVQQQADQIGKRSIYEKALLHNQQ